MDKTSLLLWVMDSNLLIVIRQTPGRILGVEVRQPGGATKPVYAIKWAADNASKTKGIKHDGKGMSVGK